MTDVEPGWLAILRQACKSTAQGEIGKKIGYSGAVVSQVLAGKYNGDLKRVQTAVEGRLMGATVECPVLGELASNRCLQHQRAPFAATNPMRVQLYSACREGCANSLLPQRSPKEQNL